MPPINPCNFSGTTVYCLPPLSNKVDVYIYMLQTMMSYKKVQCHSDHTRYKIQCIMISEGKYQGITQYSHSHQKTQENFTHCVTRTQHLVVQKIQWLGQITQQQIMYGP